MSERITITEDEWEAIRRVMCYTGARLGSEPHSVERHLDDRSKVVMMLKRTDPIARLVGDWDTSPSEANRKALYTALVKAGHGRENNPDLFWFHLNGKRYRPLFDGPPCGACEIGVS